MILYLYHNVYRYSYDMYVFVYDIHISIICRYLCFYLYVRIYVCLRSENPEVTSEEARPELILQTIVCTMGDNN